MQHEPPPPPQPQLRDVLSVLWRRKWIVAGVTILVVGVASYLTYRQTPTYRSEARVLVLPSGLAEASSIEVNLETEQGLVGSTVVAALVVEDLQLQESIDELLGSLEISIEGNTEILDIAYTDEDPAVAKERAQAFAQAYLVFKRRQAQELLGDQTRRVQSQIRSVSADVAALSQEIATTTDPILEQTLSARQAAQTARLGVLQQKLDDLLSSAAARDPGQIVQPAELPDEPANGSYLRNGVLALILGLILGIGVAFLRERLDDRIRDAEDFEDHLGARVLAVIPRFRRFRARGRDRPITLAAPKSAASEAYRAFCAGLLFVAEERRARVVMIASPGSESRRAASAANLSVTLAEAGERVVLVSADLRTAPPPGKSMGPGLVDVLTGSRSLEDVLRRSSVRNLELLGTGPAPVNPTEILHSKKTPQLFKDLGSSMDFVIIDSAPALTVADSLVLGAIVDGVVLVAKANDTTREAVARARDQFERSGAQVLGGVLESARVGTARRGGRRATSRRQIETQLAPENGHRRLRRNRHRVSEESDTSRSG